MNRTTAPTTGFSDSSEQALADRFCADVVDGLPIADELRPGRADVRPDRRTGPRGGGEGRRRLLEHQRLRAPRAGRGAPPATTGPALRSWCTWSTAARRSRCSSYWAGTGLPPSAVALAHVDRNPDPGLHAELAAAGAYLGYDGFARTQRWPDAVIIDCLRAAAERGAAERILLGGDVARRTRYRGVRRHARDGLPGGAGAAAAGAGDVGRAGAGGAGHEPGPLVEREDRRNDMNDQLTPVPPVIMTPRPDQGRLEGGNGRYEKRLADLAGIYRDTAAYRGALDADDGSPVYWVESSTTEDGPGGLITGISVLEPGRVGRGVRDDPRPSARRSPTGQSCTSGWPGAE